MLRRTVLRYATLAVALAPVFAHANGAPIDGTPIKISDVTGLVESLADALLTVSGVIVVGFVVFGAIKMVTASGNQTRFDEGKKTVINALIGGAVIFGVGVIVNTIANFAQEPTSVFEGGPL